ncbi:MAG: winged helix-turn-helix transcriptional regulator [Peptococcaceae bacterium]|nr:winged helix-turn-helix transcriptional regulator [Peptococcaceae bacterium]
MLPDGEAVRMAETFKVLGDRTRIKILYALLQKELCVCELSAVVGQSISAISHQLRVLRGARLVKYRKEGKNVYYSIDDEHIILLFEQMLDHVRHG